MSKMVVVVDEIKEDDLLRLFNDEILALRIPKYANKTMCDAMSEWFLNHPKIEIYHQHIDVNGETVYLDLGVERVGVPYNAVLNKSENSSEYKDYYQNALPMIQELREACKPNLMPFDKLRLELDENWSAGASLANFDGKKMHAGIARIMRRPCMSIETERQPHFDMLLPKSVKLKSQFAANIYIELPEAGGELELWDVEPLSAKEAIRISDDIDYDRRSELPRSQCIVPSQGDLILINTRKPHAIRSFTSGNRITVNSFIGINQDNHLMLWN